MSGKTLLSAFGLWLLSVTFRRKRSARSRAMLRHWKPIGLLLLATVLIDGIVIGIVGHLATASISGAAFFALMFSQTSLAGIWMGLGRTPGPLRMLVSVGCVIGWSAVASRADGLTLSHEWMILLTILFAMITASLLVAKSRGLHCEDASDPASRVVGLRGPWQFSMSDLLAWTTVLATIMGFLKWLGLLDSLPTGFRMSMADVLFIGPGRALVAMTALWTTLGAGSPIRRLPILVLAEAIAIALPCLIEMCRPEELVSLHG